jgi:hypothetical protein
MKKAVNELKTLSDNQLKQLQFTVPWQYDPMEGDYVDSDGFKAQKSTKTESLSNRKTLQAECWDKFNKNPQFSTSVRGLVGRLTGKDFAISSSVRQIQEFLDEFEYDPRNRLYNFWPKYVGRAFVEGELFKCLTCKTDGFIEDDFIDPILIDSATNTSLLSASDGIIYHPFKTLFPLIYSVRTADGSYMQIPSINLAYYPELLEVASQDSQFDQEALNRSKSNNSKFKSMNGFYRFIVAWDRSFITRRNVSYLRTTLEWLNHYEDLKKYEIDHKKSSGAYVWVVSITDPKSFRLWLTMSDEDKRKTGIMAKKTPGGTMILPPGMTMSVINPQLPKISEADTDIFHMITSGMNEPEDVSSGQSKGTFASVKASRGPMSDRISDEVAYFERFVKHDFYSAVFFLKSKISNFPSEFKIREAVDFDKNGEAKFENVRKKPQFLIDVTFPTSEVIDSEAKARAFLGVKHGSTNDVLGIPNSVIASKMGLGENYKKLRLVHATESELYPELIPNLDQEAVQEKSITEPSKKVLVKRKKVESNGKV